ncbi:MAG: energy-coupling factor ABC transporter ATP-binding protein [Thermoplasmata archaeon]|nr:energy-coupling factor ABC transporter ATP-binding protein [Thermoplasmata archaeon]
MRPLEIESLGFSYEDGTVALENVSLSLERGEKVAIVGPNGAGKSTLLHLIAGFRMPFTGKVLIDSQTLTESSADDLRKMVGLLFQDPDDQIFMPTVEEDVAFGPRNLRLDDIDGRVSKGLRSAGVETLAKRKPHKLSYGMKKRVAIAGIMAMDPNILLLDEPTSGLDPRARSGLIKLLKGMDRSMLIATHDLEAAAEIVDRAVVLNVGILMEGTMRDLVMSRDVLERAGLEIPPVSRLFSVLGSMGYSVDALPVSMDQAVAQLSKVIDREGRHIHAHVHEHDHKSVESSQ